MIDGPSYLVPTVVEQQIEENEATTSTPNY